ncbi:hypothetical protein HHK36_009337 [Tetracentron sinense]|uniref:Ubiquitin-like protease family profile domain-containing protein n=1 Tax=Tetracentron sinense TaxID=13715 RepID=A0A834ZL68_TETSI|nr:hypothetical protein HHK36_009337 [Tetracentron sinense]
MGLKGGGVAIYKPGERVADEHVKEEHADDEHVGMELDHIEEEHTDEHGNIELEHVDEEQDIIDDRDSTHHSEVKLDRPPVVNNIDMTPEMLSELASSTALVTSEVKLLKEAIPPLFHMHVDLNALEGKEWEVKTFAEVPKQENVRDCRVFMLKFVDFSCSDLPLQFSQKDVTFFRKRMAFEVMMGRALPSIRILMGTSKMVEMVRILVILLIRISTFSVNVKWCKYSYQTPRPIDGFKTGDRSAIANDLSAIANDHSELSLCDSE